MSNKVNNDKLEMDLIQRREAVSAVSNLDNCFAVITVDSDGFLKMHMNTLVEDFLQFEVFSEVVDGMTEVMKNAMNNRSRKMACMMDNEPDENEAD